MLSPGQLPRPSPKTGDGLPKFIPAGDDTFGAMIQDFVTMPAGIGIPMDSPQEDLPDLLRGEVPSCWGMDAPSFGELEPTQCFPSATAAWGSAGFGGCGGGAPLAFGAERSETFGAFNPQHQGQIADTAGTPFHPTTMPMVSMPYGQMHMHMVHPMSMHMMAPHHQAAAAAGYGFAPHAPPPPFVNCAAFPPGMHVTMTNMPMNMVMAMQMQGNPMQCPHFQPTAPTVPACAPTITISAPPAVVPSTSPPASLTGAYNNAVCNDGNSSGDEVVPAGPSCLLPRNKPLSMSSDDSGQQGNQVVPETAPATTTTVQVAAAFPPGSNAVMLVPYNGGLMAVRRPAIAPSPAALAAAAASAAAAAMLNHGNNHLSATSGSTAGLPMLGVPVGSTRAASLERYRQKKASRSYSKHIRYHMRKVNADRRPRVKGRFIKASVVAEVAETMNNEMDAGDS